MDYGLAIVFLCAGIWLYVAALLLYSDWRWNLGRVIQCVLCGAFAAWLLLTHRTDLQSVYVPAVVLLLVVTLFVPIFLQRRIHALFTRGNAPAARRWGLALSLLLWRPRSATFPAIEPIYAAAARGSAGFLESVPRGHWLVRLTAATSRKGFIESRINSWTALGEYRTAVELFEKHFGPGGLRPDADILYTMVIPYGEAGDLPKAARCLRRAEELVAQPNSQDLRRFVAFIHAYAQAGRVYALERLLDRNGAVASSLPTAYVRLWRGVALLRHGEPEAAHAVIASALARQREGEAWLRRIAEPYLATGGAAQAAPTAGTDADLDAIELLEERAPIAVARPLVPAVAWKPALTWGLIAACMGVWLVTELSGSSESSYTLAQFGANVSGLVKAGEWWRLVASVFLHIGAVHLLFNMYALYLFGAFVERLTGRWEMFVVFMVAGICGSVASTWLGNPPLSAGASGAIMGLLGAAAVISITFKSIPKHVRKVYFFNFIFIAVLQVLFGFFEPHIDNFAHLGGLVGGAAIGLLLRPAGTEGRRKTAFHVAGLAMALVVAVSLFNVVRNVEGGGYPIKPQPLVTREAPDRGWSVEVPGFWISLVQPERVQYLGPLGEGLLIIPAPDVPLKLGPANGEESLPNGEKNLIVGKKIYHELKVTATEDDTRITRFRFHLIQPDGSYILVFECETRDENAFQDLLMRILDSFEVHARPPQKKPPPPKPFKPHGPAA
ncbi:MAG: rhomboid family intramembrane serine protease [Candidatus Brocadiia bacterium]|jgi:membrane associated rhomboid family serine protease